MVKLSTEVAEALQAAEGQPLPVDVPGTARQYVIIDSADVSTVEQLYARQIDQKIAQGLKDIEAGKGRSVDEVFDDLHGRLLAMKKDDSPADNPS